MSDILLLGSAAASSTPAAVYTFESVFSTPALWIVALGGAIGGILQPIVAKLNPKTPAPENSQYWQSPLLGIAAAGISVYVVANTDTNEALRLFFFAVLCGLAFPTVLTSAVDSVGKRTDKVQQEVADIANKARSNDPAVLATATESLKATMIMNPAESITDQGQKSVETSAELALRNIAATVAADPGQAREVIEQLKEVATVAQSAGYADTALKAGQELQKLSEGDNINNATKKIAEEAAERIKG